MNESMVIEEWLQHYIWQGVEHFYLIDNGSTDNYEEVIGPYLDKISLVKWTERAAQVKHHNRALDHFDIKNQTKWLLVCDLDEFLFSPTFKNLSEYLVTKEGTNCINVSMTMFGSRDEYEQPPSIRKGFLYREKRLHDHGKAILRTNSINKLDVHFHDVNGPTIRDDTDLQLNHYQIMSKEYFDKVKKPRPDAVFSENTRDDAYFKRRDIRELKDTKLSDMLPVEQGAVSGFGWKVRRFPFILLLLVLILIIAALRVKILFPKNVYILLLLIILSVILLTKEQKSEYSGQDPLPKTVWILWLQGWDSAPWVPKQVAKSWEKLNPGWEIKLIDRETCPVEIYGDTPQAQSDVIRLELLSKYGGVWADSTMLCMQPLDDWVHEAVEPAGIWMYRGRLPACTGPASWFIVAKPGNVMSTKWVEACREYWKGRANNDAYSWMDNIWFKIYEDDQKFKDEWEKVPYLCCEGDEQSHMLAGRVGEDSPDLKNNLKTKPPRAVKLDHRAIDENSVNSNGYYAIQCALNA